MNDVFIWSLIIVISIILGMIQQMTLSKIMDGIKKTFFFRVFEFWRHFVSYLFTGVIGYFFIVIRWPLVIHSGALSVGDFSLGVVFLMGILGWIPYFIKNITQGINAIITRILNK